MDIIIVSQYMRNIEDFEGNNSRFVYIAKLLAKDSNNEVEIITSDFHHATKTHFSSIGELKGIKVTTLHEKGYPKNICLKRFGSHKELAKNVYKYLSNRKKPDVIYCAVPSLDVGEKVAKYCEKNNVKFIIDIQDLWPEAFQMVFNVPILRKLIFYPMKKQADYIYKTGDKVVAVSETYKNRALQVNDKDYEGLVVYLGTDLYELETKLKNQEISYKKEDGEIWIGYLGTIGSSYDIKTALEAFQLIQEIYDNVKFVLLGDGPLFEKYKKMSYDLNLNSDFLGRKEYIEAMKILEQCDIALNPLVKGSTGSIINKVGDYAALGLPVINSLQNKEYKILLNDYEAGINIKCEDSIEMRDKIIELIDNKVTRKMMGRNNKRLAEERFNRGHTYNKIINLIEGRYD